MNAGAINIPYLPIPVGVASNVTGGTSPWWTRHVFGRPRENGRRCLNRKNRRICHHKQIYFLALKSPFRELGNRGLIDSDVSRPMLWRSERLVQIYRPSMGVSSISVSWFGRYETRETGRGHSVHCALKDSRSFFARSFRKQVISYFKILEWRKYNN